MRLPEDAARALEKLESAGWESYAVGGCVRDSLLGIEPHDWDLCTAAPPEAMKKVFAGERVIETGLKHGTLTLLAPSGPLEITTFRTESGYSDCRHPDRVSFVCDIHADLARRDFTVNAMAYSPVRGRGTISAGGRISGTVSSAASATPASASGRTRCAFCARCASRRGSV